MRNAFGVIAGFIAAILMAGSIPAVQAQQAPQYKVDPTWPKPFPRVKDAQGNTHQWIPGEIGGNCVDSHDHIFTYNRSWQTGASGKLKDFEQQTGVPAPPVIAYDVDGNVVTSWGDASLMENGAAKVLPENSHGCFADYEDNIWLSGTGDGIVQKFTHDGKLLMQIGVKGMCDGKADQSPKAFFPSCGEAADGNSSKTLLNQPADVFVDPAPDPVTKQKGSIYISDGYGNHRVVVFDAKGKYLRQWGSAGTGPGQFAAKGGGHPHCAIVAKDGLVYVCDRGNNRVQVFDKLGNFKREIRVDPEGLAYSGLKANDIEFSLDPTQQYIFAIDVTGGAIWLLDREKGGIVGGFGSVGRAAGQFVGPHTIAIDSKGNVYVAEVQGGRRIQKFVRQ